MSHDINRDRLVHYLAGECTEEEEAEIEAWIHADPAHRRRLQEMRRIWNAAGERATRRNVNAMWDRLSQRMELPESKPEEPSRAQREERPPLRVRRHHSKRHAGWKQPVRTATLVAVIAATAFLIGQIINADGLSDQSAMREVATEAGERARVKLGDGTHVMLNAKSRLTMPAEFEGDERIVHLQGEAYFEVAPDEERPFVVHAGGTVTRVLGTKFNVGAYPEEDDVNVVVAEGKVSVRTEEAQDEQELLLMRSQMASLSKASQSALRRQVDPSSYMAWTDGRLVFNDAPFDEVSRKLERWYGLQVKLEGAQESIDRLNATFKEEPLAEVLNVIAESLRLRYEREGKTATFSPTESR